MPLGYERLNERSQRPNTLINFIKPLQGPDKATSEDFLDRIAAQCYPVMKAARISVMSLEEFEPNNEFLGRNFNAGEVIQLVLKDKSGRWLGFKYVQMVMMHELAHCKQMNHSKYFWQVRNQYAQEMYDLWAKQYLGEGVWGKGRNLASGGWVMDRAMAEGDVPEHLCGGTYRKRGRKRKRGTTDVPSGERPTYAERQQRRIAKKFGKHGEGNALGEDDLVRGALEQGRRHQGKPRVANSKRGRDLRAQAALARFEAAKAQQTKKPEQGTHTDDSDVDWSDSDPEDDISVVDDDGYVMVCSGGDDEDGEANNEMDELLAVTQTKYGGQKQSPSREPKVGPLANVTPRTASCNTSTVSKTPSKISSTAARAEDSSVELVSNSSTTPSTNLAESPVTAGSKTPRLVSHPNTGLCPICSLENELGSLLCLACAHVLRPKLVSKTWHCQSSRCEDSKYLNAGDVGRCGICGSAKPAARSETSRTAEAIGLEDDDLFAAFALLRRSDEDDAEYSLWKRDAEELPTEFSQLQGVNLEDRYQCITKLFPSLRFSKAAIDFYLDKFVFAKEMKEFPYKLTASGWDIGRRQARLVTGFSGTSDSYPMLPLAMQHLSLPESRHTNSIVLNYLLQRRNAENLQAASGIRQS